METAHGFGIIGMHRGRTQGDFGSRQVDALDATLNHLRRAITIRSALVSRTREVAGWQQIFASTSAPTLILDRTGLVRQANTAGEALLSSATLLELRGGHIVPCHAQQEPAFRHLLLRATDSALPEACQGAFGAAPGAMWIAEFLPLVGGHLAGCAMLTVIDRAAGRQRGDVPALLREVHGLTRAEAEVACALGEGFGIDEIAARRGSAVETVRAQLKQIMAKTGTRKQSEVVALVLRLTLL